MKIMVTGGAGFIGSAVVDKLIERGDEVVIVDNLVTGKERNLNPKAKFYNISITDAKLESVFENERPEYVIHQAAQVDVGKALREPMHDAEVNILGSLNVLENCRKYGVKKIVYGNSGGAGSGEPQYFPVDEAHPIEPMSPYGVSKHTVEHYLKIYSQLYDLKFTSLGYANVYGPRQDPFGEGGVIAIFTYKLSKRNVPVIFGNGEQTRDFIFVGDVADANIAALTRGDNERFTVGTGKEVSLNKLVGMMNGILGTSIEPEYTEERKGDIMRSVLSRERIGRIMRWAPQVGLQDGLRMTMEALQNE
jgi:UDP-glucose 4-epimerase